MWYKVKQLHENGLNKSQIRYETGLDRKTIRRYLSLTEQGFHEWISKKSNIPRKLSPYYQFVKEMLEAHPYLSSPQIEDKMKERYPDMPDVHSRTIHNFVVSIRNNHKLSKTKESLPRQYAKLPETAYGEEAQVDFGQALMRPEWGNSHSVRIYFFVMVLSRSRQKYVYCQDHPFNTTSSIYAHERAFEYFQGIPRKILYDQDRVFIYDENLGDIILTDGFRSYCMTQSFTPVFCRKADPESKGKVENVVKYVKYNFLRGRSFHSIARLQTACMDWLKIRGNGKIHGSTLKVPYNEWLIEKEYLQPLMPFVQTDQVLREYAIRKDNTIRYRGNYYSLPLGTFKGPGTKVLLEEKNTSLIIYNMEKDLLAKHEINRERGVTIIIEEHRKRDTPAKQEETYLLAKKLLGPGKGELYLELMKENRNRYWYSNLKIMLNRIQDVPFHIIDKALDTCLENSIYNGREFSQVIISHTREEGSPVNLPVGINKGKKHVYPTEEITPLISNINYYESIL